MILKRCEMKRLIVVLLIVGLIFVSCGKPDGTDNGDDNGNHTGTNIDMIEFDAGGVSFDVPKGWDNQRFLLEDPPNDLVRAASEVVFYPKDQKMDDLIGPLSKKDFRYTDFTLGDRVLVIFMKGFSGRYYPGGTSNERMTFYEGTVREYSSKMMKFGETEYESCQAFIDRDGLKSGNQALMFVFYEDKQPMVDIMVQTFSGIAVVAKSIGLNERDIFNSMVESFQYMNR